MNTIGKSPGVYIDEITGPGVIAGVSTSVAAFIGPALAGPVLEAVSVPTYDDFLRTFAVLQPSGAYMPHIVADLPRRYYLATAVQGFFANGGGQAYVVRVSTGAATTWEVKNQDSHPAGGQPVFRLQATALGTSGNSISIAVDPANATGAAGVTAAQAASKVSTVSSLAVTVGSAAGFAAGDSVTADQASFATITAIDAVNGILTLDQPLPGLAAGKTLTLANLGPNGTQLRLQATTGLYAGSVVLIEGTNTATPAVAAKEYTLITAVDAAGFITLAGSPVRTNTFDLSQAVTVISQEFQLTVSPPGAPPAPEVFKNLSLNPQHPGYVFTAVTSEWVQVLAPLLIPTTSGYPAGLVAAPVAALTIAVSGLADTPGSLGASDYQAGLDVLNNVDDVNLVVIPDAAAHASAPVIQQAMLDHCQAPDRLDRFAILDSRLGLQPSPSGPGTIGEQRQSLSSPNGYGALYYPWIVITDPLAGRSTTAPPIAVPPCGHIAGVYALTDDQRGVHKAPANVALQGGVLGLERRLNSAEQGPLNEAGIDVLRIFQGSSAIQVWGARTLYDPGVSTDWRYVPIRRLLIYLEQSIEAGIRWAVFEPNNLSLWGQLKRTISEFLTRVWRSGALFGATADQAFYVRIDEGLNPPSTRALGQLYIEIGVAPSYPAEFVIVRIGLWDGGAAIAES
jgi:phage tail sheath protein FI